MKKTFYRRLLMVALLLTLLLPSALALAQSGSGIIVNVSRLNLREGPGVGYRVIAVLAAGANVTLLGRNPDTSWVQVGLLGGTNGWVNARYVSANVALGSLPVTAQGSAASARVHAFFLNVRTGPNVGFPSIGTLGQGDGVSLIGRNFDASWAQIVLPNGTTGWVNSGYLVPSVPIATLPITDGAGGGGSPQPAPTPTGPSGVITAFFLNVRYGPDVTFGSFTRVTQGQTVLLLGRNAAGNWVNIQIIGGANGWVNANYLRPTVSISSLPIVG
jgi:N-acetylmuramoyl-L-alanine amidase